MPNSLFEKMTGGYLAGLYVVYLTLISMAEVKPQGIGWNISTVILPMIELAFFGILALTFWKLRSSFLRYVCVLVSLTTLAFISVIYLIQVISVMMSGEFISALALGNATEIAYVVNWRTLTLSIMVVGSFTALLGLGVREFKSVLPKRYVFRSTAFGFSILVLLGALYSEANRISIHSRTAGFAISIDKRLAPLGGFHLAIQELAQTSFDSKLLMEFSEKVTDGRVVSPFEFDVTNEFPFQRSGLNSGPLPFSINSQEEPLNVIILFLEGFSARVLDHYGGPYSDLTPNLNKLAANSITVDNYYNHTAATYRGLQGSLASGFPYFSGAKGWEGSIERQAELGQISYATLPKIFNALGYDTRMFSAHQEASPFDEFLISRGFSDVVSRDDVFPNSSEKYLTDRELFSEMTKRLIARDESNDRTPFFWSSYNVGTHAFFDSPPSAKKYRDGSNAALNRFHELDTSVGVFLDAFEASSFAENTLLVITADHSTYAEPPVIEAFKDSPKFTRHFVDQIPLLIRAPRTQGPIRFENGVRTSLDLAPSILHLLGIENTEHAFLGTSVFDTTFDPSVNWAVIGKSLYRIDDRGVSLVPQENMEGEAQLVRMAVSFYNQLEQDNRIFAP